MKQFLILSAFVGLLSFSGGCAALNGGCLNKSCDNGCGDCGGCSSGGCSTGGCSSCSSDCRTGLCGSGCNSGQCGGGARGCFAGCATGCRPGPLSWQQGGSDYAHKLSYGMVKHGNLPQNAGPQSASVGYPYYTVRGPRDFLLNNPPTIGR